MMTETIPARTPSACATRITFEPGVAMRQVQDTLALARMAAESLHGTECVDLDAHAELDAAARTVTVDTSTAAGRSLAMVFLGYCRREFGDGAVRIVSDGRPELPGGPH
jgi:hypothetical protein